LAAPNCAGATIFGPAVNRNARLLELGHGGQILATASTAEVLAAEREVDALEKSANGPLDDPAQTVDIYQVVAQDLPREFPALRNSRNAILDVHNWWRFRPWRVDA